MTPEFASLVNPAFHYVLDLVERVERDEVPNLKIERDRIRSELDDAGMTTSSPDYPIKKEDFDLAKQAIVYWADDVLTDATVNREDRWAAGTLEWEIYGERERAVKFYEVCEQQARRASMDVLEVFYLCVVLGFRGDILDSFHRMRKPFPPETVEDDARGKWAAELSRQIPSRKGRDLTAPPLEGDVRPLGGAGLLKGTAQFAAVLVVSLAILILWLFHKNSGGG